MVGKVDEACVLEAVEDGLCGCGALGRGTVEEEREVYELEGVIYLHVTCDGDEEELTGMKRLSPSTALVCGAILKSGVVVARGMYRGMYRESKRSAQSIKTKTIFA